MIKLGPRKYRGSIWDEGGKTKIVQILISHGYSGINSIQFVYVVDGGKMVCSEMHGEPNGSKFDVVTFNHPEEYLVSISGEYVIYLCGRTLGSIAFSTNNHKYGPFGGRPLQDCSISTFAYNFTESSFAGFHGSVGKRGSVNAIGVYISPLGSLDENETDRSDKK